MGDKILTREKIEGILREVRDPVNRFIILAVFEGILGKDRQDLINVKIRDFHDGTVALASGKRFAVSPELTAAAKEADRCGYWQRTLGSDRIPLVKEDRILKRFRSQWTDQSGSWQYYFQQRSEQMAEDTGQKILFQDLYVSGKVNLVRTESRAKEMTPRSWIQSEFYNAVFVPRYGSLRSRNAFIIQYEEYLT